MLKTPTIFFLNVQIMRIIGLHVMNTTLVDFGQFSSFWSWNTVIWSKCKNIWRCTMFYFMYKSLLTMLVLLYKYLIMCRLAYAVRGHTRAILITWISLYSLLAHYLVFFLFFLSLFLSLPFLLFFTHKTQYCVNIVYGIYNSPIII